MSILSGQQPFHALTKAAGDPQQDLSADLAHPFFVPRELSLGHPNVLGEGDLVGVEAAQFSQASPDQLPVHRRYRFLRHRFSLTPVYQMSYIITRHISALGAASPAPFPSTAPLQGHNPDEENN